MAEPRTAGEWAAFCRNKFMASTDPLPGHIPVGLCLDCARAYARQVGEAGREADARICEFRWITTGSIPVAALLRARPVEVP